MLTMIHLMVHGHPSDSTHTLYGLYDAAKAVGYRRKAARHLAGSELFAEAYWAARAGEDLSTRYQRSASSLLAPRIEGPT